MKVANLANSIEIKSNVDSNFLMRKRLIDPVLKKREKDFLLANWS